MTSREHADRVRALLSTADKLLISRTEGGLTRDDHHMIRTLAALAQAHAAAVSLPVRPDPDIYTDAGTVKFRPMRRPENRGEDPSRHASTNEAGEHG